MDNIKQLLVGMLRYVCQYYSHSYVRRQRRMAAMLPLMMQHHQQMVPHQLRPFCMLHRWSHGHLKCFVPPTQHVQAAHTNTPLNSLVKLKLNVNHNPPDRPPEFDDKVGDLLELMDLGAGLSVYRYAVGKVDPHSSLVVTTACMDKITQFDKIHPEVDIECLSYVNYVGNTSLEVQVDALQGNRVIASALFTMLAKQTQNPDTAYPMPGLNLSEDPNAYQARLRYERSVLMRNKWKQESAKEFQMSTPNQDEVILLMKVLRKDIPNGRLPHVSMGFTTTIGSVFLHSQHRNYHGKISVGYIVRKMLELAWYSCMKLTCGQPVKIVDVQGFYFRERTTDVGNGLELESTVCFTEGSLAVVVVTTSNRKFESSQCLKVCQSYVIFESLSFDSLPQVEPKTLQQAKYFLAGKRRLDLIHD